MTKRVQRLLHITDTHLHASPDARMRGVTTDETLRAVLAQAMCNPDSPDAILITGDLVQDETRAGYERLRGHLDGYELPVYCIPGNHDAPRIMASVLAKPPFQVGGQAQFDDWRLILLSSFKRGDDGGWLSPDELQRLANELGREDAEHYLICLHHHPVPTGSRWLDGVGLYNADEFLEIIDSSVRVRGIVWGHVHQTCDRRRHGVRLLSTPATCMQFLPNSDDFKLDTRPPGYRWLDLYSNGRIDTEVVWLEDE
ncbi:MAG TPA: phosphodiesterase [Chromatiales bacterium]|nr:phosphodiesterase [Chromatiales bacterium]